MQQRTHTCLHKRHDATWDRLYCRKLFLKHFMGTLKKKSFHISVAFANVSVLWNLTFLRSSAKQKLLKVSFF